MEITMLAIGILIGFIIGINAPSLLSNQNGQQNDSERIEVSEDDDPFLGLENAPVTLIEFSDFECPFCRRFYTETLPLIKEDYVDTGKVKFVYRDFPLESIHPSASKAAQAANCAGDQDKYWEYHDLLFENQTFWANENSTNVFKSFSSSLALDEEQFNNCLDNGKYEYEISKDLQDGLDAGVNYATPTFYVNGIIVVGAQPYEVFKQVIDSELEDNN